MTTINTKMWNSYTSEGALRVMNEDVDSLHTGNMYSAELSVDIGTGATVYIKGRASKNIHLLARYVNAETSGSALDYDINLYEGGLDEGASGALTAYNVHRAYDNSNNTFNIYETVTNADMTGAIKLPFGEKKISDKKFSTESTSRSEYILAENTNYYLEITNNDGGTLTLDFTWFWINEGD